MAPIGAEVYIVGQIPLQLTDVRYLYFKMHSAFFKSDMDEVIHRKSVSRSKHDALQRYNRGIFRKHEVDNKVRLIVLDDVFCGSESCLLGTKDQSFYSDYDHLSHAGSMLVADEVMKAMTK